MRTFVTVALCCLLPALAGVGATLLLVGAGAEEFWLGPAALGAGGLVAALVGLGMERGPRP